ncbi:MAG: hypothetical protein N2257_10485 [Thermodesulfovibrionales bacterium]|nr:hypothetical protein [Thermodesulfovibrionales bacterium]
MIFLQKDYDHILRALAEEYFIFRINYVPDIKEWAKEKGIELSEPGQFMKLISENGSLVMVIQSDIKEEILNGIINSLSVRWSLKDNVNDPTERLNSTKKRLVYCFLKEYIRTRIDEELHQDEWVIRQMEKLGYFTE